MNKIFVYHFFTRLNGSSCIKNYQWDGGPKTLTAREMVRNVKVMNQCNPRQSASPLAKKTELVHVVTWKLVIFYEKGLMVHQYETNKTIIYD